MTFGIPDTRQFPWDVPLSRHLGQLNHPTLGGINNWSVKPTVGIDGATLGSGHVGYTGIDTSTSSLVRWDGTAWVTLMDGYKLVSTPQLDVYVNQTTGSDSNDGKTASTAWQTISKFYQELNKYNLLSKQVNLYLGAGTYGIIFPPTTYSGRIKVIGASSASVTIQYMYITNSTLVILQDVTIANPGVADANPFFWPINVSGSSSLQLGQNIVLGPVGNYLVGSARFHIQLSNNSTLYFFAGSPVTLTGSVNNIVLAYGSFIQVSCYYAQGSTTSNTNIAPAVDTGAVYTGISPLTSANTTAVINASGSVTVGNVFSLADGSNISGVPNWQLAITGSVSGAAYALTNTSGINGYVSKVSQPSQGILYPSSISSGTKDSTSAILGSGF